MRNSLCRRGPATASDRPSRGQLAAGGDRAWAPGADQHCGYRPRPDAPQGSRGPRPDERRCGAPPTACRQARPIRDRRRRRLPHRPRQAAPPKQAGASATQASGCRPCAPASRRHSNRYHCEQATHSPARLSGIGGHRRWFVVHRGRRRRGDRRHRRAHPEPGLDPPRPRPRQIVHPRHRRFELHRADPVDRGAIFRGGAGQL